MKESDKKRLQINCSQLVQNIMIADIQDYLYEKDVISSENLESLVNEKLPQKAARYLVVSILPRKGPHAFQTFCDALRENGYEYLAEQLETTKVDIHATSNDCNDNKCAHEKKQLKHQTKYLEEELTDVTHKLKNTSCEDGYVRQRDKETIEHLQMENFKLKKQLSFYEEPNANNGARSKLRRKASDNTVDYSSLANPRGNETSVTSFDSGLSDMDPEDIVVDVDDAFDSLDGALSNRSIVTPRHKALCNEEDSVSEEKLIDVLAMDIINCMYNDQESNPKLLDKEHRKYVIGLRKAVKTMSAKHEQIFRKISDQVGLQATWREINEQMGDLFKDLLANEFHQQALTWGKILSLFSLTGFVAKRCAQRQKVALPLSDFLASFIDRHLSKKIVQLGGWDTFCHLSSEEELNFTCIFPASMLQAAINSGSTGKSRNPVRNSLATTTPSKILTKRHDVKSRNFLKTF